jgi:hypothetical protein
VFIFFGGQDCENLQASGFVASTAIFRKIPPFLPRWPWLLNKCTELSLIAINPLAKIYQAGKTTPKKN